MKIAFVDTLGLCYDGTTLTKRGLGGSESAVILCSRELAKLGFDVTVFNDCFHDDAQPGVYDNVRYLPLQEVESTTDSYDVLIGSRSVAAFAPADVRERFKTFSFMPDFTNIQRTSRHKVLWMHDTFCDGDDQIESFLHEGRINEVFVLSDFHLNYATNCDHGRRRMFEVLKRYMFQTRNGMGAMNPGWVDVLQKDPNLFVYNSSLTKGMVPLVKEIWPRVKQAIPDAKLTVIGGFYRFREGHTPDQQELDWRDMVAQYGNDINFTGVIPQQDISDILRQASYMIYPCAFPETFGISTLEALAHNVPIITCNFGAEEETAIDSASYKIPYPIEPNGLFPFIDKQDQINKFVDMAVIAYNDRYLHQQKMYACNAIKDICGWDSVALQWKQHLYHKLGEFLPIDEYRRVQTINHKVRKVFGRRFTNPEELVPPRREQKMIGIVTAVYNAEAYVDKCIRSIAAQDYDNYTVWIIDDASTDNTVDVINRTLESLPKDVRLNFTVIKNKENVGAVANHFKILNDRYAEEDFYILLDGDDWLVNDPNILQMYNNLYHDGAEFTYGSCWSLVDNIPLVAQPYPPEVRQSRRYRDYRFNWNMPYTHLRTFHAKLLKDLTEDDLKVNGQWARAGGDTALFYYLIEKADPDRIVAVTDVVCMYNDDNPINDYKVNGEEQTRTSEAIIAKRSTEKFSVIIPTMWRCRDVFGRALNDYVACDLVDDIVIINNDKDKTPLWTLLDHPKIRMLDQDQNIYCNPAWNLGAHVAKNDRMCFVNDDIEFDMGVLDKVYDVVSPTNGAVGMITGESHFGHPEPTDYSISVKPWEGEHTHGFGQLFFVHKKNWEDIPAGLDLYYGDDFIFQNHRLKGLQNYIIYNFRFNSPFAQTTSDPLIRGNKLETERPIFEKWFRQRQEPQPEHRTKSILIALPCRNDIEAETFKCIYDLEVPEGYKTTFQFFYGYAVDQVRNLIAHWAQGHDYLFAVDHDVTFPPDTLKKLIVHDKPIVGGIYRQRTEQQHIEVYDTNYLRMDYGQIHGRGLVEIGALGFGCVLVKSEVFRDVGYPQFEYHQALDHAHTFSEDLDFCKKARNAGYSVWCDDGIRCGHIGAHTYTLEIPESAETKSLRELSARELLPKDHVDYLYMMRVSGMEPKVIYDIGACVLHWTNVAKRVWPHAEYVAFEAMDATKFLYEEAGIRHVTGVPLYREDGAAVEFYQNTQHPGGNSIYRENNDYSGAADVLFPESAKVVKQTRTLDSLVAEHNLPLPDLIKIDIQGAELDALKGARNTLASCNDLILELQHVEYNMGAPAAQEIIDYVEELGFRLVGEGMFCGNEIDGDYHFRRVSTSHNQ